MCINRSSLFNTCEICGDFPSFIPEAAKFVFLFARLTFINFVDCFKVTAISFIDSIIFLFSVSLISPPVFISFRFLALRLFLYYAVPMIQATNIFFF